MSAPGADGLGRLDIGAAAESEMVARELWRLFLTNLPKGLIGNAGCAVLFGTGLWWATGDWLALAWIAAVLGVTALRYAALRACRAGVLAETGLGRCRRAMLALTALGGLAWGVGCPLVIPWTDFPVYMLLSVFIAGLNAGAMMASASVLPAYILFVSGMNLPLAAALALHSDLRYVLIGLATLLFTVLMIAMARSIHQQTREVFVMRGANRQLIADLEEARDRALESDRTKSRFLANMSHELRTPLNIILGFAQSMERCIFGPVGDERYVEYARLIRESGEHLLSLINDVLDLSRVEAGAYPCHPEAADVRAAVDSVVRALAPAAETGGIRVTLTGDMDPPPAWVDPRGLRQILLNLVSNAIKFTPGGGEVEVAVRAAPAGGACVVVSDTGIGIAEDKLTQVVQPFVQADTSNSRKYEGTGLGLALSKQLAELNGGRLELESTLGEGTRVTLTLPPPAEAAEPDRVPAA